MNFLRVSCAGDTFVSRGLSLEKKIEALEGLTGQVSFLFCFLWPFRRISVTFTGTILYLFWDSLVDI